MLKRFWIVLLFSSANATAAYSQAAVSGKYYNMHNPDAALPSSITNVVFLHLIISGQDTLEGTGEIEQSATIENLPDPRSLVYESSLKKSDRLYDEGNYLKAAKKLKKAYKKEPDNPFIQSAYARALYWNNDSKYDAYQAYKKLVRQLDQQGQQNDTTLYIDFWFREAYWKLGTLHMEYKKWEEALFEVSRAIISIENQKGTELYNQAMTYITECAYQLGNKELCQHFGERALLYNPENDHVLYILQHLD